MKTVKERFLEKIKKDVSNGCWEWTANKTHGGYGKFWLCGKHVLAHRFSYELFKDSIPEGKVICHSCDNPWCVNPDHLWLGTQSENIEDSVVKNRFDSVVKISSVIVKTMKKKRNCGAKYREIAEEYGIGLTTVYEAVNCKTWKHVS